MQYSAFIDCIYTFISISLFIHHVHSLTHFHLWICSSVCMFTLYVRSFIMFMCEINVCVNLFIHSFIMHSLVHASASIRSFIPSQHTHWLHQFIRLFIHFHFSVHSCAFVNSFIYNLHELLVLPSVPVRSFIHYVHDVFMLYCVNSFIHSFIDKYTSYVTIAWHPFV
jgi:hypothetical protein